MSHETCDECDKPLRLCVCSEYFDGPKYIGPTDCTFCGEHLDDPEEQGPAITDAARELADMAYLDQAACRLGTRLDIPSKIPGFDPGDSEHIHFVMVPIGADARRAAVEWLKKNRPESMATTNQPSKGAT